MSRDLFNLFQDYNQNGGAGCDHHESVMNMNMNHKAYNYNNLQGYDDPSCMSFTESLQGPMDDYNSLARAFGLSPSSSEVCNNIQNPMDIMTTGEDNNQEQHLGGDQLNPHSSVSSSSTEAGAEEDSGKIKKDDQQPKGSDDGGSENSKKGKNEKKKGEKRVKEPRFAFMTKSEVDHLEDGYRWRKYGQKAVKNSPYPRSYYRCTAQKCTVKKRVERSYQDPTTVITTYEGQHSHPLPTTLRGNMAGMYSHSMLAGARMAGPSYAQDLLFQMPNNNNYMINNGQFGAQGSFYPQMSTLASLHHQQHHQHQFHQVQDNGLLQDIVPSMFLKHDDH